MAKSIARNSMYNILYKMLNIGYPLITTAYISRILLPSGIGKISLAQTFVSYFITLASLGIPNYGIKLIGAKQDDFQGRSEAFSELFILNLISSLIALGCFFLFRPLLSTKADNTLLLIFGTQIIFNIINIDWFYQGIEEYAYIAIRSTIVKIVSLVCMFAYVRSSQDYISYAIILCCATFMNYIFNIINVRKYILFSLRVEGAIRKHIVKIVILFASVCASEVYTMLDSTMIGIFCSEQELGYYSNSIKLIRVVFSFVSAMCMVYFPRISYLYNNEKKDEYYRMTDQVLKLAGFFSLPAMFGIFSLSEEIVRDLFGSEFLPASLTIQILSPLITIFSVAYVSGHIILISVNREKDIMVATIVGALSNIILNYILIKSIGYNGAGIATVLTELIVTIFLCIRSQRFLKRNIKFSFIKSIVLATILMIIFVYALKFFVSNTFVVLIVSVICGCVIYCVVTWCSKNDVAIKIVSILKSSFTRFIS